MSAPQAGARTHGHIVFPTIASALGGAQEVTYSARYAWITMADGAYARCLRSKLPAIETWTAFNLADAVSCTERRAP